MRQSLYAVILILFVASCGRSSKTSSKKTIPIVPVQMENVLDHQNFQCQSISGGPCPEGIARLFIISEFDPRYSVVCTGFMINANTLVTNNHCVADEDSCHNTFVSVRTKNGSQKFKCKDIVYTEGDGEISRERANDITIFHVDNLYTGPVFKVSGSRAKPGQHVSLWVIDHKTLNESAITELSCDYVARPGAMEFNACPAIAGNSGSPIVIDGTTTAIGVLWGSTVSPMVDANFPLAERRSLQAISLGTDLFPFLPELSDGDSSLR